MDTKMTIRFTLAEKWQDLWFRKLLPLEKLLFLYICDNCNIAGIWEVDLEQAAFFIGTDLISIEGAYKGLAGGYETLNNNRIWLKNFLEYQRNTPLNPNNAAHATIINLLLPYKDLSENILQLLSTEPIKGLTRGLQSPLSISIGKGKGKSTSKSKSIYSSDFEKFWLVYPKKVGKGEAYKSWRKINPPAVMIDKLISAVEQQKKSEQWCKENGQYIPNPSTWLNQSRWDDELAVPKEQNFAEALAEYERLEALKEAKYAAKRSG